MMVVLATVCVSMIAGLIGTLVTRYSTTSALEKNLLETAELAALAAENMISTYTLVVAEMASNPIFTDETASPEEKQELIQERVEAYYMRFGGLADANGYDRAHDVDISSEPFFQEAVLGKNYMSEPYIEGNDMYLMISAPVRKGDQVKGVLYFQCDTYILNSIIEGLQIGEEGEAYILDKNGTTIAYVDLEAVVGQENVIRKRQKIRKMKVCRRWRLLRAGWLQGKLAWSVSTMRRMIPTIFRVMPRLRVRMVGLLP